MFRLVRQVRVCLLLSLTACSSVYMKLDKTSIQNNKNKPTATESNNQPGVEPINQPTHLSSQPTDRQTGKQADEQTNNQAYRILLTTGAIGFLVIVSRCTR